MSNNLGKAAEAFGKVFPLCVSSNFTEPGMVIATAIQARAVTRRALLPIRVLCCVALRCVAMCCNVLCVAAAVAPCEPAGERLGLRLHEVQGSRL